MAFGACNDSMTERCMGRLLPRSRGAGNCPRSRAPPRRAPGRSPVPRVVPRPVRAPAPGVTPHPAPPLDPGPPRVAGVQVAVPARGAVPWRPGEHVASAGCARMLPPVTHTRDPRLDISQARQVLKDALRTQDAREIVRWLEEHSHELTRSRFFELMFSFGPLAGTLLNAVSRLLPTERRLLGEALGRAFAPSAVRPADVRRAAPEHGSGARRPAGPRPARRPAPALRPAGAARWEAAGSPRSAECRP